MSDDSDHGEIERDVVFTLRDLACVILRGVAGGGHLHEIPGLMALALEAMIDYQKITGHGPSSTLLQSALDPDQKPYAEEKPKTYVEQRLEEIAKESRSVPSDEALREIAWAHAKSQIRTGALRVAASMLAGQATQRAHGDNLMFEGIRELTSIKMQMRKAAQNV